MIHSLIPSFLVSLGYCNRNSTFLSEAFTCASIDWLACSSIAFLLNSTISLREIIQNSIDACKSKQEIYETSDEFYYREYSPKIYIIIDSKNDKVIIKDNGIGMSNRILKQYFLNVGKSFYTSKDYFLRDYKYKPIGHYGIGFLSCFMLSDNVHLITKNMRENEVFDLYLKKGEQFVTISINKNSNNFEGTEIFFDYKTFKKVFETEEEIVGFVNQTFLNSDIPIYIENHHFTTFLIKRMPYEALSMYN